MTTHEADHHEVVHVTRIEPLQHEIDAATAIFGLSYDLHDPETAWWYAVTSGKTAAQMAGTVDEYAGKLTARLMEASAAYGWWPKEFPEGSGEYIAVKIEQWVAEGHPFTTKIPDLATLLDRWNIPMKVVDAEQGTTIIAPVEASDESTRGARLAGPPAPPAHTGSPRVIDELRQTITASQDGPTVD